MSRIALLALVGLGACTRAEDRLGTLEARLEELERKNAEQDASASKLAPITTERELLAKKLVVLEANDADTASALAVAKAELTAANEQLAAVARTAETGSVELEIEIDEIGVKACDRFIEKYSKCIREKVPEVAREQMIDALEQTSKAWKEVAEGPSRRDLGTACNAAYDAAKQATSSMGCEF